MTKCFSERCCWGEVLGSYCV